MTGRGRFAGGLIAMLIPALLFIATIPDVGRGLAFAQGYAAAPIALPPMAGTGLVFAGLAAWLAWLRRGRIAMEMGEPVAAPREPSQEPLPAATIEMAPPPLARAQPEGADLAARARFVAMSFAFPESGLSRAGPGDWPLQIGCHPVHFTLTLCHAALGYRLEFANRGAEPLGPLIIRADLVAAESRADFDAEGLPLCHYIDGLAPGDSVTLTGELHLPLAGIAAMRLGTAELLVPLLRLAAESAGDAQPVLSISAGFAIGLPPHSAGGGIQPFRLDSGPGIWRKLTARRLMRADLP